MSDAPRLRHYALGGIVASILLNFLLRTFVKLGGPFATLLISALIAAGLALAFRWRMRRAPYPGERIGLVALYGLGLGVLYLGLLALMESRDGPGSMGLLLFFLHYACYPVTAWFALSPRWFKGLD